MVKSIEYEYNSDHNPKFIKINKKIDDLIKDIKIRYITTINSLCSGSINYSKNVTFFIEKYSHDNKYYYKNLRLNNSLYKRFVKNWSLKYYVYDKNLKKAIYHIDNFDSRDFDELQKKYNVSDNIIPFSTCNTFFSPDRRITCVCYISVKFIDFDEIDPDDHIDFSKMRLLIDVYN